MTNKLTSSTPTLKIRRTQDIDIDIKALTDSYELAVEDFMRDALFDRLTDDLDLSVDTADYITQTEVLTKTILAHVKTEMFNRALDRRTRA